MGNGISVFMPEVYRTVRIAGQEGAVGVKGQMTYLAFIFVYKIIMIMNNIKKKLTLLCAVAEKTALEYYVQKLSYIQKSSVEIFSKKF